MGCGSSKTVVVALPTTATSRRESGDSSALQIGNNKNNDNKKEKTSTSDHESGNISAPKSGNVDKTHDNKMETNEQVDKAPTEEKISLNDNKLEEENSISFGFADFPTPERLKEANVAFGRKKFTPDKYGEDALKPYPAHIFKDEFISAESFVEVDTFAVQTPESMLFEPLADLVAYLTRLCKDQIQCARALFSWLSVQHLVKIDTEKNVDDDTAYSWLQKMENGFVGYDHIYYEMCLKAGIQSHLLQGFVKGENYYLGEEINDKHKSGWLALLLEHCWRMVDVEWALRGVTGSGSPDWVLLDDNGQLVKNPVKPMSSERTLLYRIDESAFLPDPHHFIYSHFPTTGEEWQLLARPVTLGEFTEMAQLKPNFFELGLKLRSHLGCVVETMDGECELEFDLPQNEARRFMYRLWISTKDGQKENLAGTTLDRYVYMEQNNNILTCKTTLPVKGKFKFELYGRKSSSDEEAGNQTFSLLCAYLLNCESPAEDSQALPKNPGKEWGPGENLKKFGVSPVTHESGTIEAENGTCEIRFKTEKEVEILAKLHKDDKSEEAMKNFIVHQNVNDELIINGRLPMAGDYALDIYAKEKGEKGTLPHVCSYLVMSGDAAFNQTPYANAANGELGAKPDTEKKVYVVSKSHTSALIEAPESGELEIVMGTPVPCDLMSTLSINTAEGLQVKDNSTFLHQTDDEVKIWVRFPDPGNYILNIYGKEAGKEGSFPNIYTYAIEASYPAENASPFPKVFGKWETGCELITPLNGILPTFQRTSLACRVPKAKGMAMIGSEWTHLEKDEGGVWRCDVTTGAAGENLNLAASYDDGSPTYSHVLQFLVEDDKKIKETENAQVSATELAKERKKREMQEKKKRIEDFNAAKEDILSAISQRNVEQLRKAIKLVEKKRYIERLKKELKEAKNTLASLERIQRLKHAVLKMNAATMSEVRKYPQPPLAVHDVMIATTLLLGDPEELSRNWQSCQALLKNTGPRALNKRVKEFDVLSLKPEVSARAKELLQKYRLDDVRDQSAGAATFYAWSVGMIEESKLQKKF